MPGLEPGTSSSQSNHLTTKASLMDRIAIFKEAPLISSQEFQLFDLQGEEILIADNLKGGEVVS